MGGWGCEYSQNSATVKSDIEIKLTEIFYGHMM